MVPTAEGKKAVLWTSGWTPRFTGETIFMARATGSTGRGAPFVKMRPEDLDAGGMETVFPWRESDGDGTTVESHHRLNEIVMGVRNPVMLIRIKPGDMDKVVKRQGQESFNFGDLFAYTKVCSHLGCPSSLYEQQTLPHPVPVPPVAVRRAALRDGPYSVRLRARWRSCRSPLTRTGIWSPTATSSSPSDRHSGSGRS